MNLMKCNLFGHRQILLAVAQALVRKRMDLRIKYVLKTTVCPYLLIAEKVKCVHRMSSLMTAGDALLGSDLCSHTFPACSCHRPEHTIGPVSGLL